MMTTTALRLAAGFVLAASLGACSGSDSSGPADHYVNASCVGPQFTVTPTTVAPGASVRIRGQYFLSDCADTGGPPAPASTDLPLRLDSLELARVDACGPNGVVSLSIRLPAETTEGPATLHLGDARPVTITIDR